jgi:hypothetical protein
MMCGEAKELMAASWPGELDRQSESKLKEHLEGCAECSKEMAALTSMWNRLGDLPVPEPSQALHVRWQSTIESVLASERHKSPRSFSGWIATWWPKRAAFQFAICAACLLIGLAIGLFSRRGGSDSAEIARLREEVSSTREMVALSLLRQQSATDRLRGIDYSGRMRSLEPEVKSALIQAVNHDPSVNVRLAAIDALNRASADAAVRSSLAESLERQDSPMVQAALIDYMVDARDREVVGTLRRLAAKPEVNQAVRQRAHFALEQLSQ